MKLKNYLFLLPLAAIMLSSCGGGVNSTKAPLKTATDTANYYLGYLMSTNFTFMPGMENPKMDAFIAGFNTGLKETGPGKGTEELDRMNAYVQQFFMDLRTQAAENNMKKADEFLEKNKTKSGVIEVEEGIQYKIKTEGNGDIPTETDIVKVHYKGTLIDGTQFDSSYDRGEPAEFALNGVIPGWTKSISQMPVGSTWTIYIHPNFAYGAQGSRDGSIGPNEALIFEVELLEIVRNIEPAQ